MASSAGILHEQEEAALAEYAAVCRLAKSQLRAIWADLELTEEAARSETDKIVLRAHEVWSEAVAQAKHLQQELHLQIDEAGREARSVQEELGQSALNARRASLTPSQAEADSSAPSEMTTHARLQRARREVEYWRARKAERMEVVRQAQAEISRLQGLLGKPGEPQLASCVVDISDGYLETMQMETDALRNEQSERATRMAGALAALQAACERIGEQYCTYAEAAHPSLAAFSFDIGEGGVAVALPPEDEVSSANLSNTTFKALEKKMAAVEALIADRERQVLEVAAKLEGLWQHLGMLPGDVDRELTVKMLGSSERLLPATMEACQKEYERLEVKKARKTCHTIRVKHEELAKLTAEAHLEDAGLSDVVQSLQQAPGAEEAPMTFVRRVEEALARVQQSIDATRAAGQKRAGVLAKIAEIQGAVLEAEWLKEYEQDSNRFKGRDSGKNINRSIKAEKVRAGLPALLDGTIRSLGEWEDAEGEDFLYDGIPYKAYLASMKGELEQLLATKGGRGALPRARGTQAAATASTPSRTAPASRRTPLVAAASKTGAHSDSPQRRAKEPGPRPKATPLASASAKKARAAPEPVAQGPIRTLRPASLATTLAKNLMDLDVNSPTAAAATQKTGKRDLQIDVNCENLEPPAKQATPTPSSEAESQVKGSSLRMPGKSMLKQPTSVRGRWS